MVTGRTGIDGRRFGIRFAGWMLAVLMLSCGAGCGGSMSYEGGMSTGDEGPSPTVLEREAHRAP